MTPLSMAEKRCTTYRCETTSLEGFVQQLAACYLPHGYHHCVVGHVPDHKQPVLVDEKLMTKYDVACSRWERARRKQRGRANIHYLRWQRLWVLLATDGDADFFREEARNLRDLRADPIVVGGYSIRIRQQHSHVRIEQGEFTRLKARLVELAAEAAIAPVSRAFWCVPWEPYAPVRSQLFGALSLVNDVRKRAGVALVPSAVIRRRRRVVRPFELPGDGAVS